MPGLFDHLLVVFLVVVMPLLARLFWFPRLKRLLELDIPGLRLAAYRQTMVSEWLLAAAGLAVWLSAGRPLPRLGLAPPAGWEFLAGLAVVFVALLILTAQLRKVRRDELARESARRELLPLLPFLPHTEQELNRFMLLGVTAGICEEVLYRGFLIWYLSQYAGLWGAVILSSLFFGLAHLYQGTRGSVKAGLLGLLFAGLYLFTGSLWVPMLLHALIDIRGGQAAYTVVTGRVG